MKQPAKIAILQCFKTLLTKHSMDKITVKEICTECHVNRQTFYYYFTDLMDVFKCLVNEELAQEIANNRTFETWEGGFLGTMNYLKRNSKMILHIYHSSYAVEANRYSTDFCNHLLIDVVEECMRHEGVKLSQKDQDFIVNFYRHVFSGLMLDWVNQGMDDEPEMLLCKLQVMIRGSIPRSVVSFSRGDHLKKRPCSELKEED